MKGFIFIKVSRTIAETAYERGSMFIKVNITIAETAYEGFHIYQGNQDYS